MKSYSQKRAEMKDQQHTQSATFAMLSEGKRVRKTAVEAFKRPPYQMKKKEEHND